ncbi:hypothetical protein BFN03_00080 [Rhodococcus sp. WMMA185]|nr:hypothetical protein BFN03_00080 [Rhodococcus sp. WMMA185]
MVGGIAGAGILSSTQPSTSTTAPDIQLAGFASDLGDYLFPGIGQAAVDAATRASETGDPKEAFVRQFPNLVSPTLSVVSYFLPWDPIALYASFYAMEQVLNTGELFPSGLTNPGHDVSISDLSAKDREDLAKNLDVIDSNLRKIGIDVDNLDPNKVRSMQSVLDSLGAKFDLQSAVDELKFARGVLNPEDADGGTSDEGTSDDGTSDEGTSDDGTSDEGTSDEGTSDDGTSDDGTSDDGTSDEGTSDEGTTSGKTTGSVDMIRHAPRDTATE